MNVLDVVYFPVLAVGVRYLASHYLKPPIFSLKFRKTVIAGGVLWLTFALASDELLRFIFGHTADAAIHDYVAREICRAMEAGNWKPFNKSLVSGNPMYQAYVALVYYLTGASSLTINMLNAWFAFWGGLILARHLTAANPTMPVSRRYLLLIFFPSVVFWTTAKLKEGLMFWSITTVLSTRHLGG
ncbi:MAG: hypothetical protein V2B18_04770, partial [Pseudomonadota bacterium]